MIILEEIDNKPKYNIVLFIFGMCLSLMLMEMRFISYIDKSLAIAETSKQLGIFENGFMAGVYAISSFVMFVCITLIVFKERLFDNDNKRNS